MSGLFDANYYLLNATDVTESGIDPLAHYCGTGWAEDRPPNPYFHPSWYRRTHRLPAGVEPLRHYIQGGEARGLQPCRYFDPVWYAAVEELPAGVSPLADYLARRRAQRVSPMPLFDVAYYCASYPGLVRPNRDAFLHYLTVGATRDLRPNAWFDAAAYRHHHMTKAADRHAEHVSLLHLLAALGGQPWFAVAGPTTLLFLGTAHLPVVAACPHLP